MSRLSVPHPSSTGRVSERSVHGLRLSDVSFLHGSLLQKTEPLAKAKLRASLEAQRTGDLHHRIQAPVDAQPT